MDSTSDGTIELSIVVPVYGSASTLAELVERLLAAAGDRETEIILVNDASPDSSWPVLAELAVQHSEVRSIDLLSNHGQPMTTMCGLSLSQGEIVVTIDDDLEHPPEELAKLLEALETNPDWDGVVGTWDRDRSAVRNLGSWLYATVDRIAWGTPKGFRHSGFRAIRRPAVDAIVASQTRNPLVGPLLVQLASNVHNVEVAHDERAHGSSGFRFRDGIRMARNHLRYGSTLPLLILARFGSVVAVASFLFGAALLVRGLLHDSGPQGWLSTFTAVIFFGGSMLFAIGLLGQYVSIIISEVRQPPRWSVRRTLP